jgi:RHS repeat-associated protein
MIVRGRAWWFGWARRPQSYTYDAKDRLISVQKDAFSVSRDGNNTVLTFVGGARPVSGVSFAGTDPDAGGGPGLCYTLSALVDGAWTPITPLTRSGLSFTFASVLATAVEITVDAGDHPGVSIANPSAPVLYRNGVALSPTKEDYTYDAEDRRISQTDSTWSATGGSSGLGGWVTGLTTLYAYDGSNLIAEINGATNKPIRTYAWGLDSGGGIGGLLTITTYHADGTVNQTYRPLYDGRGNVTGLVNAVGQVVATYTYSAFGTTTATWNATTGGAATDPNPFRFSTKYFDSQTGLYYYGYRFYSPQQGRWINPDPIGVNGGANDKAFCGNDPINVFDALGEDKQSFSKLKALLGDLGATIVVGDLDRFEREFASQLQGEMYDTPGSYHKSEMHIGPMTIGTFHTPFEAAEVNSSWARQQQQEWRACGQRAILLKDLVLKQAKIPT